MAMRNVFMGASEGVFEVGRDGSGKSSFGSFRVPSGSACTSFAAGRTVSFGRLDDSEGGGRGGFTNDGGSGLCGVVFGDPRSLAGGIEGFVNVGGSGLRESVVFGASRGFSCGIEGFVNLGGSDACGFVALGASRGFSGGGCAMGSGFL